MEKEENKKDKYMAELLGKNIDKEDELFTRRVNLFLVAESLFFVSYVTLLTISDLNKCNLFIIIFLGIAVTVMYWFILSIQIENIKRLKDRLEGIDPIYKKKKREIMKPGHANTVLGIILPVVFLVAWVALLVINCC